MPPRPGAWPATPLIRRRCARRSPDIRPWRPRSEPFRSPSLICPIAVTIAGSRESGHSAVHLRDDLERALALGVVKDVGGDHQLVGAGLADEILEPLPHGVWPADDRAGLAVGEHRAGIGIELRIEIG